MACILWHMTNSGELLWTQAVDDGDFELADKIQRERHPERSLTLNDKLTTLQDRKAAGEDVTESAAKLVFEFQNWKGLQQEYVIGPTAEGEEQERQFYAALLELF